MTSHTAAASTVHEPIGNPAGPGLWHHKGRQLPAYIQHVAHHLIGQGHDESKAIEMAVGIVRNWAEGHDGRGNKTHPDVQAAAAKAMAEWEALKAGSGKARRSAVADKKPYGDVTYADPKNGKYPIDTEAHARAAWSYVNQADNAAQYPMNGVTLSEVKDRIMAACKKFGIDVSDDDTGSASRSRLEWRGRIYPLEDIHIVRSTNERDGRIVEAYATVFEEPAAITDDQGKYLEVIDRSAFNKVLADVTRSARGIQSVKVMFNHGRNLDGEPSDKYLAPIGVPVDIRPEARGLLTRTRYARTQEAEQILSLIEDGAITSQSFTGRIVRSTPELAPGQRSYQLQRGQRITVRRMELGLREYGPVLWPAYSGAEILGVRMSTPDAQEPDTEDEALPPDGEAAAGEPPAAERSDEHSARYHQHRLFLLRSQERREKAGLTW